MSGLLNDIGNILSGGQRLPPPPELSPLPTLVPLPGTADRNGAANDAGAIKISLPTVAPSVASPSSAASSSSSTTTTRATSAATTPATSRAAASTKPATTPLPLPSTTPSATPETTPLPPIETPIPSAATTLEPLPAFSTSTVPSAAVATPSLAADDGLGDVQRAEQQQQQAGFVLDPTKNPAMMALVIAVPIALALLVGITVLLFKKGCIGSGRRRRRGDHIIQDEMEHEAWRKKHAEKFGPSANY